MKPERRCVTCKTVKPAAEFEHSTSRRCAECWEDFRSRAVCRYCGAYAGIGARRGPRAVCDSQDCQRQARQTFLAARAEYVRARRARTSKVCSACGEEKPLTIEYWFARSRFPDGSVERWDAYCRECKRADQRARYQGDPRRRQAQLMSAKAQRERIQQRRANDPDFDRKWLEQRREWEKAYRERRKNPRLALVQESSEYGGYIPVAPLYETVVGPRIIDRLRPLIGAITRNDDSKLRALPDIHDREALEEAIEIAGHMGVATVSGVAEEMGVSPRTVNAWVSGERPTLRCSVLESILDRLDLFWWDVYEPGVSGYETARRYFEGDLAEAA